MTVWTIGHSNRPLSLFLEMLRSHGVTLLVDVRIAPRSRYNPQFDSESLAAAFSYRHLKDLGGYRKPRRDSVNTALEGIWRGYADHMATPAFQSALAHLMEWGAAEPAAIMCAEASPAHCHRSFIADALTVRGIAVRHILDMDRWEPHRLRPEARVDGDVITYPGGQMTLGL